MCTFSHFVVTGRLSQMNIYRRFVCSLLRLNQNVSVYIDDNHFTSTSSMVLIVITILALKRDVIHTSLPYLVNQRFLLRLLCLNECQSRIQILTSRLATSNQSHYSSFLKQNRKTKHNERTKKHTNNNNNSKSNNEITSPALVSLLQPIIINSFSL